ncbi:hypothetical protein [Streptomyces sp. DB-54]
MECVVQQVAEDLAEAVFVAECEHLALHLQGDRPAGVEEAGGGGGVLGEAAQVDGFGGQWAALVESGEER